MRRLSRLLYLALLLGVFPITARADAPARSIGAPNRGRLEGGVEVESSETIHGFGKHRWGLPELVAIIVDSAARVAERYPGSVLEVGDLSREKGGEIKNHDSHESGRDADLAFYLSKGDEPFEAGKFLRIDVDGSARGRSGARFDDARNWSLVEALLTNKKARVMQIFVARHLRARLLAEGARAEASRQVLARARAVLMQPREGQPHDDHFHVRIRCPKGQQDCLDFPVGARPVAKKAKHSARRKSRR